ncbi:ubiquitin, putative [Plasmodium knowlesi strain H]|uniref:Ubiquitin, putative n=2 Tax=Plasmodium knowlesi (strain H) TaxID=5851 RepID=A0A5K1TWB9_PLAKH|nr:ubiquitin, putative [Plasmodium knowlesi strain H]CAA9986934.1 ubiquitin, putative [Plasmodium knowlesi strain H]SBO26489.1 ubiquitin, putative [Plasmodium knowlesi strain H]SBO28138.1 ubiquitin, putative [Plasmodium knowlesi strain H]VVS76408.1 ubiquitin, putative [Plasmodium knowlesi strain H]|eukprot:XP_002258181.1 hypothetical protein, conserved in Plasmodium species [Plasmodium knowlesi strain H]
MVGRGVCWNATICLCCIVLVFLCSGVKLSRYQYGRCSKRSCLMDMSISGMARRLRKEENEPIKTSINEDNCSSVGKQDKISSQDNPAGRCTTANRWSILINCYDQWDAFRNRFFLTVDENECVRDIKEQIERIHGIPSCIQQILYQGKSLADDVMIKKLTKGIKIHLLNLTLMTMLPHIFSSREENLTNEWEKKKKKKKKKKKLEQKIKYVSYLVLLEEYKNLLNHLEKNNYVVCEEDIANSFSAFDKGFPKMVQAKGINLDKIKKEIEELQHVDRKKPLLRLGVDFPLMSNQIVDRFKELVNFYYLGDIKSVVKFSLFFFILYKYANYPPYVKRFFLYLSICFILAPWKAVYMLFHFSFFFVPRGMLFSGLTNILSASYQQILMCQ